MTRGHEKIGSLVALGFGIFYLVNAFSISTYTPNQQDIGSRAYPIAIGALFTLLSMVWVATSFRAPRTDDRAQEEKSDGFSWARWGALLTLLGGSVALLQPIGFVPVATVFIFGSILVMVWSKPTLLQLLIFVVVAIAGAFAVKLLLGDFLGIYLP